MRRGRHTQGPPHKKWEEALPDAGGQDTKGRQSRSVNPPKEGGYQDDKRRPERGESNSPPRAPERKRRKKPRNIIYRGGAAHETQERGTDTYNPAAPRRQGLNTESEQYQEATPP